jgi:predicted nucleotidyltransferase
MRAQHERVVQRLVQRFQNDPRFPALIIGGSVAKGWASENSDVDILLVATDEEFARRMSTMDIGYYDQEIADYPDGYVDGKIIDLAFLREAADHGSEPARAAFLGAIVAYTRIPGLDELIASIPIYPEQERAAKMRAFASQFAIFNWYVGEAEKRQNRYLLVWATNNMVLYGGRLILAHNRLLYPYHKWFLHQLQLCPAKPERILDLIDTLLLQPNRENARLFYEQVMTFANWELDLHQASVEFTRNTEWNWREGHPPLPDW